MRLVVAGTPDVALPSLDAIAASPHEIVAVLTRPDTTAGRGRKASRSPVARWADEREIDALQPERVGEPALLERLADLAPDCCPVVAYGQLIPQRALELPRLGWVNLHFSLLPAWRGAAPVQHAVIAGDEVTGASVFQLEAGLDTGPVYGVATETVRPRDTAGDLLDRLATSGAGLLVAVLDGLEAGALHAVPQSPDGVSLAPKLEADDARVRWDLPAIAIDRRIRGCTPAPGAWTTFRGDRVRLGPVEPPAAATDANGPTGPTGPSSRAAEPAGLLVASRAAVDVATATGRVRLGWVQPPGKRPMPAADWARGVRIEAGEVFA